MSESSQSDKQHSELQLVLGELHVTLHNMARQVDYVGDHHVTKNGPFMTEAKRALELLPLVQAALSVAPSAGAQTFALTFDDFRRANVTRCLKWHPSGIESWSPSDWLTAVTGELGELASLLKMRNRERDGLPGNKFSPSDKQVADELADVLTYLDLLAAAIGVDLGRAAVEKFNEVSVRVGFPDRIELTPPSATERSGEIIEAVNALLDAEDMRLHNDAIFKGKWKKGSKAWSGEFIERTVNQAMVKLRAILRPRASVGPTAKDGA
jgi:NTP pyrophosphatase (non-canonical NTP hydrolase)